MCMYSIATEYNGPLEAAHAQIDDDRYDMVECGVADKPTLELTDQLHGCSITTAHNYRMSSANVHV